MNNAQFANATGQLMNCINCDPHDRERIRRFLCKFTRHVIENVSAADIDRLETEEIVQRIPDMEVDDA